jgi:Fe-S-cluster-containing hydrogenase component 2
MTIEPRWIYDEMHMDFVPVICFQCDDPLCVSLCPADAISKRNDGIVVVDEEVCTGCKPVYMVALMVPCFMMKLEESPGNAIFVPVASTVAKNPPVYSTALAEPFSF